MVGKHIGPYKVLESLGSGGMGEVFLALDTRLGRKVALKTLKSFETETAGARPRVVREARAAARLNHPGIGAIYDVIEDAGRAYIVMEYVEGETLAARLARGRLGLDEALSFASQISEALASAHSRGVVHRDLKPANIVITPLGRTKILDFGLAKTRLFDAPGPAGSTDSTITESLGGEGKILGTPAYMPPEQLRGEAIDARSDIFSLGVVLYEMIAGSRPFPQGELMPLAAAILTERPASLVEIDPAVPAALSALVEKAMAKNREERPASAQAFLAELERCAGGLPAAGDRTPQEETDTPATDPAKRSQAAADRKGRDRAGDDAAPPGRARRNRVSDDPASLRTSHERAEKEVPPIRHSRGQRGTRDREKTPAAGKDPGPPVVAVLPFSNNSSDTANDALCAGIEDVLVSDLAGVGGLNVVARAATLKFRSGPRDPDAIGREIGAALLVEGGLQRAGDRIRVTVSLLRVETKLVVWSSAYDGAMKDVFDLESRLAADLAGALRLSLTSAQRERLAAPPTTNVEAFADYAQARSFLDREDATGNVDRAIQLFQSAIRKDPRFSLAHAGLGEAYWARFRQTREPAWTEKARGAALEALRLDPGQDRVHYTLAMVYHGTGRANEAIEELREAITLQPANDDAHRLLGEVLARLGRLDEAVVEFRRAIELRPNFAANHRILGRALYRAGHHSQAIAALTRAIELQPDSIWAHQTLGAIHHSQGDLRQAAAEYEEAIRLGPNAEAYSNLGTIHYGEGRFNEAALAYGKAVKLEPGSAILHRNLGDAFRRLGLEREARAAFERAVRLCEQALVVNPQSARDLSLLAIVEAKLGHTDRAEAMAREASQPDPTDSVVLHQLAAAFALSGRTDEALWWLRRAIESGLSPSEARADDDLACLRTMPGYEELTTTGR